MKLKDILAERARKSAQTEAPKKAVETTTTDCQGLPSYVFSPIYATHDIADERGWDF